ncbi:hypothetical protein CAPTEDRAFT_183161 [Capitella teleta]|uniref:2'-5' RNA ligase n=1 Tax=Capitella teleta TaxID=283909 RepID=R7U7N4_CAPTE|nr:hypothetical protein CAPTEDRAFT_183161 [Capitella teleta]|eukprot:ELT99150.1 hypothetical protein CAPTEDRAFT_183161 [Capitella teleta]
MASNDMADAQPDIAEDSAEVVVQKKSFKSSIVIIPPKEFWEPIQMIRKKHDKAYERWMPHVNLLYPFIADANDGQFFSEAAQDLKSALKDIQPFKVCFTKDSFKVFKRKKFCTLWLKPIVVAHPQVLGLQESMVKTFPQCNDVNKIGDHGFTPHLSLGQLKPKGYRECVDEFSKDWTDMEFTVDHVTLISRADFDDPFHVRHEVPLGSLDL